MSLYYEAASLLSGPRTANSTSGSLKSRVYSAPKGSFKSAPAQLYALLVEAQKYAPLLSEVIENSGLLESERKLTPTLSVLLLHDHLLTKGGIAAPKGHVLREAVLRHKARLSAEFTRLRVRRGNASVEALKASTEAEKRNAGPGECERVRWIRVNALKNDLSTVLADSFKGFQEVENLSELLQTESAVYVDPNIPNLVAIPKHVDMTKSSAYKNGSIILQDKASCFPAYLLDPASYPGDVIDACAAPGNKTTHLAALLKHADSQIKVHAFELSPGRSRILQKMVTTAGADSRVTIHGSSDFLKTNPHGPLFRNVTCLLLDPSCSGSGILGRDETDNTDFILPRYAKDIVPSKGKKKGLVKPLPLPQPHNDEEEQPFAESSTIDTTRLQNLSQFQLSTILHAFTFPSAKRITYSTCSLHSIENENVVSAALLSPVAKENGWTLLQRDEQVEGLKNWRKRGSVDGFDEKVGSLEERKRFADSCIRCDKGGKDATGGFFVACFVRDAL